MTMSMFITFYAVFSFSILFALWKGGQPERAAAYIMLFMAFSQLILSQLFPYDPDFVSIGASAADIIGVAGFSFLAIHANRMWPIAAASLQVLCLFSLVAMAVDYQINPLTYQLMGVGPTFTVALCIILATAMHLKRLTLTGHDADWTDWTNLRSI